MNNGFSAPEIEQAAVSAMMQWKGCLNEGAERLSELHFSVPANRTIYSELIGLWRDGREIELISFTHHLRERRLLDSVGGAHYVTQTQTNVCHSPLIFGYYVDILSEELAKRELLKTCNQVAQANLQGAEDPVGETINTLSEIPRPKAKAPTLADCVSDKLGRMENGEPDSDIIKTDIHLLDTKSPLRRGDFPLIAGQRKSGKSILALTIATNVARNGLPVLYFSLEDRQPKVMDRLFAGVSRIPMNAHHVHKLTEAEIATATKSAEVVRQLPLIIRDDVVDLNAIIAVSRQAQAQGKAALIIVDYAQLVRVKSDSRREEVEKVSRDLRLLAMELDVPVILICQLNKEGDTRETKALEMDATAMWKVEENEEEPNQRFICIPWQRNGESNISFPATFLGSIARFENYRAV